LSAAPAQLVSVSAVKLDPVRMTGLVSDGVLSAIQSKRARRLLLMG
jgi:hypothetical protein